MTGPAPAVSDARATILARVRDALGPEPDVPEIPRHYLGAGAREPAGDPSVVARFAERVAEYRATVHRVAAADLDATLARLTAGRRTASTLPDPADAEAVRASGSSAPMSAHAGAADRPDVAAVEVVVTGCAVAIADTGTIVLDAGPVSGPRALTLIPDHHVCVVGAEQVVAAVPDAINAVRGAVDAGRALTFVSGPSATSDIELERVEGVHGPRRLDVVLVG